MKSLNNNRGLSLIEIVLVVAILSFLAAVLTPQILKRVEEARISADGQLADSVKRAVIIAMSEVQMTEDEESGMPKPGTVLLLDNSEHFSKKFGEEVADLLGYDSAALMTHEKAGICSKLKSKGACKIAVTIDRYGNCTSTAVINENGSELITIE